MMGTFRSQISLKSGNFVNQLFEKNQDINVTKIEIQLFKFSEEKNLDIETMTFL